MARTVDDFLHAYLQLLPRGPIWDWLLSHPTEAIRYQRYKAYAVELARADQHREDLLLEANPRTANHLLGDWEATLAIVPTAVQTQEQRQNAVITKLFGSGNQSGLFYTDVGAGLGHTLSVKKFKPLQFGDLFGSRWYSLQWRWAWVFISQQAGPDEALESIVRELVPAHIFISFQYNGGI